MTLLAVEDLTIAYGNGFRLRGLSLPNLNAGEIIGVIGPNASGKSTLLRGLAGATWSEGKVALLGTSMIDMSGRERQRRIAFLPQSLPQASALLAYELVLAHARAAGVAVAGRELEARVEEIFRRLELTALAMRPLRELSGGKRQLVGVALMLVRRPQLVLLDEPTSALDLRWQFLLLGHIRDYVSTFAAGCLVALHDVNLALRYCDKLVLLDEGRLIASGTPREVVTRENLAKVYGVDADVRALESGAIAIAIHGPTEREMH
jgi:iron complex transport system ATP-binding protein